MQKTLPSVSQQPQPNSKLKPSENTARIRICIAGISDTDPQHGSRKTQHQEGTAAP
jgi:hypothetical protein